MGTEVLRPYDCLRPNPNSGHPAANRRGDRRWKNPASVVVVVGHTADVYAGSACGLSPSPRSLPLPSFFLKRRSTEEESVDYSATMDLRRLLRLD